MEGMVTGMSAHGNILAPEFQAADPYGWLSGDEDYQFPAEWLKLMADSPEKHSARILASIDEQSFARYATYVNPVRSDPEVSPQSGAVGATW